MPVSAFNFVILLKLGSMNISEIRIQNFKSFKDSIVSLNDINLFIGANNSGKTNFFRALLFLKDLLKYGLGNGVVIQRLLNLSHNKKEISSKTPMGFTIKWIPESGINYVFRIELYDHESVDYAIFCGLSFEQEIKLDFNLPNLNYIDSHFYKYTIHSVGSSYPGLVKPDFKSAPLGKIFNFQLSNFMKIQIYKHNPNSEPTLSQINSDPQIFLNQSKSFDGFEDNLAELLLSLKIYRPDPNRIIVPYPLNGDEMVNEDASNLVSFFDKMKDINIEVMDKVNQDLNKCISEFKDIRFDTIRTETHQFNELKALYHRDTFKKFGISDENRNIFWAEELSEGAIYFIALLAIIHQPNPPRILMIEEPEKGIHPRRIQEIVSFLQELCHEKQIQVILTTHSPIVVDQFSNDTSKVFVFDKIEGVSSVSNLKKDIIDPINKKLKSNNVDEVDFETTLGENWIMGLLNGVPND